MLNEDFSKQAKIETALLSTCMNFDVIPRLFKRGFDKNILWPCGFGHVTTGNRFTEWFGLDETLEIV